MTDFIFNDVEKFTKYIPTAAGSNLEDLKPYLESSEMWLKNELLGFPLYYEILRISKTPEEDSVFDGTFDYSFDETIPPADILKAAEAVICHHAYLSAIPFLDVVQTPNGFSVVNNTNHAPASKERVERLLLFVEKRFTDVLDYLLQFAFSYSTFRDLWAKDEPFKKLTETVYLTTSKLRRNSGNKQALFSDKESLHVKILEYQEDVCKHISRAYFDELIEKYRTAKLTEYDKKIFSDLQIIIGLKLQARDEYKMIERTINYMIEHPEKFSTYINSQEYRIKISPKYENKKSDSTFFFG